MITRILTAQEQDLYDSVAVHPVQTWLWGEFQKSQGHKIYRLGVFDQNSIKSAYTISFHRIPKTPFSIGTILRGPAVDAEMVGNIHKIATDENAIFVKLEPDVYQKIYEPLSGVTNLNVSMDFPHLVTSPKVAFYPHSYILDLTKTEDELLEAMHSKTRYNVRVANRHGVTITEETNDEGFEIYLRLIWDTTKRQGFYLHSQQYHRDLWRHLKNSGMVHIMLARYQDQVLSAFMLFTLHDKLFYPYGASLDEHRETMASTLLMWESIKLGKKLGCKTFDMWGSLGPSAKAYENGYGFHRFKEGFGGQLTQFVGSYDLVVKPQLYSIYNLVDKYRWQLLRLKAKILHLI